MKAVKYYIIDWMDKERTAPIRVSVDAALEIMRMKKEMQETGITDVVINYAQHSLKMIAHITPIWIEGAWAAKAIAEGASTPEQIDEKIAALNSGNNSIALPHWTDGSTPPPKELAQHSQL